MFVLGLSSLVSLALLFYNLIFTKKIYPKLFVAGTSVSGLTQDEAVQLLSDKIKPKDKIVLVEEGQIFEIQLESIDFSYNFPASIKTAYGLYRTGNILDDLYSRLQAPLRRVDIPLKINLNEKKLQEHLLIIAGSAAEEPLYPSAIFVQGKVVVEKGTPGKDVDLGKLSVKIIQNLSLAKFSPISIPINSIDPTLSDKEAQKLKAKAEKFIGKSLSLNFEYQIFTFNENDIFGLLDPKDSYKDEEILKRIAGIAKDVNREPQNARFVFLPAGEANEKGYVKEFTPAKDGMKIDTETLKNRIIGGLSRLEALEEKTVPIDIPVQNTPPKITTEEVNSLGIKGLVGRGRSRFSGSISSRVHNIKVASSKFNGVLVAPNEIFSFNETLGDVSVYTGYKQAYIIKDGKTVLGDGGGVCQVSTTFFRAVLDTGLPIVERRAHSYRVSYYEQSSSPGLDATVYDPTTDLKFKNDTPGYLLIQTQADAHQAILVFEIYGTPDGRIAKISKSVVTDIVPPPEDLYIDDPTLPWGEVKQIDWKAWGAKVSFNYSVEKGGETIYQKTFYSNYHPWQAVYLSGTGPVE